MIKTNIQKNRILLVLTFILAISVMSFFGLSAVTAAAAEYYYDSDYSNIVALDVPLQPLTISLNGFVLSWNRIAVSNPHEYDTYAYTIFWSGGNKYISNSNITVSIDILTLDNLPDGSVSFYVIGHYNSYDDDNQIFNTPQSNTVSVNIIKLATPTVSVGGNGLTWNTVSNATKYRVEFYCYVYDDDYTYQKSEVVTTNSYNLRSNTDFVLGYTYTVSVFALSDAPGYVSSAAGKQDIKVVRLTTPVLTSSGTTLSWNQIYGAAGYRLYYNSHYVNLTTTSIDVMTLNLDRGVYNFKVKAIANGVELDNLNVPMPLSMFALMPFNAASASSGDISYWLVQAECAVKYVFNGMTSTEKYSYGDAVAAPTPIRDGYRFLGWFTDEDCTKRFDVEDDATFVTNDMTLYAGWQKLSVIDKLVDFWTKNTLTIVIVVCSVAVVVFGVIFVAKKRRA